jgi:hypothetical protein
MVCSFGSLPDSFRWAIIDIGDKCQTEWPELLRCNTPKRNKALQSSFEFAIQNLKQAYSNLDESQKKSFRKYVCLLTSSIEMAQKIRSLTPLINCVVAINEIRFYPDAASTASFTKGPGAGSPPWHQSCFDKSAFFPDTSYASFAKESAQFSSMHQSFLPEPSGISPMHQSLAESLCKGKAAGIPGLAIKIPPPPSPYGGSSSAMEVDSKDTPPKKSKPVTPTPLKQLPPVKDLQFPHKLLMGLLESKNWEPALESALQLPLDDPFRKRALGVIIEASKKEKTASKEEDIIIKKAAILAVKGLFTETEPNERLKNLVSEWSKDDLQAVIRQLIADNDSIRSVIAAQLTNIISPRTTKMDTSREESKQAF